LPGKDFNRRGELLKGRSAAEVPSCLIRQGNTSKKKKNGRKEEGAGWKIERIQTEENLFELQEKRKKEFSGRSSKALDEIAKENPGGKKKQMGRRKIQNSRRRPFASEFSEKKKPS